MEGDERRPGRGRGLAKYLAKVGFKPEGDVPTDTQTGEVSSAGTDEPVKESQRPRPTGRASVLSIPSASHSFVGHPRHTGEMKTESSSPEPVYPPMSQEEGQFDDMDADMDDAPLSFPQPELQPTNDFGVYLWQRNAMMHETLQRQWQREAISLTEHYMSMSSWRRRGEGRGEPTYPVFPLPQRTGHRPRPAFPHTHHGAARPYPATQRFRTATVGSPGSSQSYPAPPQDYTTTTTTEDDDAGAH